MVNQAFGIIMGPLGGALMTVAAPALLITQVYYEGIGIVDAAQYYQATGDNRLLMVRSSFFLTDFTLTFLTWRLRPPTCNCLAHCFPVGTLVATEHGQRAIETVREGERVWAMDLKDGQWKLRHVLQTFERVNDQDLLSIKIGDETIQVTPGHPFWVVRGEDLESRPWPEHAGVRLANAALQGRWVDAGELRIGDVLYLKNGELPEIKEILVLEGGQQVYNFHVEELASYAVGEGWVLVHNSSTGNVTFANPWDILFSHPINPGTDSFAHGPWAGRKLDEAIEEARRLGRLPKGLTIEAGSVVLPNGDCRLVSVNNRTLYVARQAKLDIVKTVDKGGKTFHKLQRNFRNNGLGGPLRAYALNTAQLFTGWLFLSRGREYYSRDGLIILLKRSSLDYATYHQASFSKAEGSSNQSTEEASVARHYHHRHVCSHLWSRGLAADRYVWPRTT